MVEDRLVDENERAAVISGMKVKDIPLPPRFATLPLPESASAINDLLIWIGSESGKPAQAACGSRQSRLGYEILAGISPIRILKGNGPARVKSMILEWASVHERSH